MLALVMPQTVRGDEPLDHYVTSVDAIEQRTGFDFFHELDDAEENRMEASNDPDAWHLRELARQPRHTSLKTDKRSEAKENP